VPHFGDFFSLPAKSGFMQNPHRRSLPQRTFTRGYGKIFYFQPGHETNGSFYNPYVRRIIQNAVRWCYNDKNRRITLGAPSIEVTLEQARLEGNTGEYLKMWD